MIYFTSYTLHWTFDSQRGEDHRGKVWHSQVRIALVYRMCDEATSWINGKCKPQEKLREISDPGQGKAEVTSEISELTQDT